MRDATLRTCLMLYLIAGPLFPANLRASEISAETLMQSAESLLGGSVASVTHHLGAPLEVVRSTRTPDEAGSSDEEISLRYAWGSVSLRRAKLGSTEERELLDRIVVESASGPFSSLPPVGAAPSEVIEKVGPPSAKNADAIVYRTGSANEQTPSVTFVVDEGRVTRIIYSYAAE